VESVIFLDGLYFSSAELAVVVADNFRLDQFIQTVF